MAQSPPKPLSRAELDDIATRTRAHYASGAEAFRAGTRGHDVSQNIGALLAAIEGAPPHVILDLGCGPGRDLAAFALRGHRAVGLDATLEFVEMARAATGCDVWHQDFLALRLPPAHFDGVFANASLFHVPSQELPRVLGELRDALKPRGVLFCSNPHGDDVEVWNRCRYGAYHRPATWQRYLDDAGFDAIDSYYRPAGLPRAEQPWFASVWRKR
jgi:SAM-dependent methyltransferase